MPLQCWGHTTRVTSGFLKFYAPNAVHSIKSDGKTLSGKGAVQNRLIPLPFLQCRDTRNAQGRNGFKGSLEAGQPQGEKPCGVSFERPCQSPIQCPMGDSILDRSFQKFDEQSSESPRDTMPWSSLTEFDRKCFPVSQDQPFYQPGVWNRRGDGWPYQQDICV